MIRTFCLVSISLYVSTYTIYLTSQATEKVLCVDCQLSIVECRMTKTHDFVTLIRKQYSMHVQN